MAIEQIDLLLIHRPDPFMDHHETGAALDTLITSGKVRAVGVSNFKRHDWSLLQSAMKHKIVTNQIEISVLANQAFTNGDIAFLQEQEIRPMAWSPLAGGALFSAKHEKLVSVLKGYGEAQGADISAVAIAWLLAHPVRIMPVLGTNNLARIAQIADATKVNIDRQSWFEIYEAANGCEVP
jgi:predicted oxidoreductase